MPSEFIFSRSSRSYLDKQKLARVRTLLNKAGALKNDYGLKPDDGRVRPFSMPPLTGRIFIDDTDWIIFYINSGRFVVANLGSMNEELPHLWRKDAF